MTKFMDFALKTHALAKKKGWWGVKQLREFPEVAALIHCEISEAVEEWREGNEKLYYKKDKAGNNKPEGLGIELADAVIRILDYCVIANIDIDKMLKIKHEYNKTRPYRHGDKRA